MFRDRARAKRRTRDLDRPLRLVSFPAGLALAAVLVLLVGAALWLFAGHVAVKTSALGVVVNPPGNATVSSPVDGVVAAPLTPVGTRVVPGQVVADVRGADGALQSVGSPIYGTVVAQSTDAYAPVHSGDRLVTVAPATEPMSAVVFVPASSVGDVEPGLAAQVAPDNVDVSRTGVLLGTVQEVSKLPVPRERLEVVFGGNRSAVADVLRDGPVHEVVIGLDADPDKPLGLAWSGPGPRRGEEVTSGVLASAQLVVKEQSPWEALLGLDGGDSPRPVSGRTVAAPPTGPQQLSVGATMSAGGATVELEVARTPHQQETGLSFRTSLAPDRGMAFALERPAPVSFWMKDTLIPLDMVFLRDGVVTNVAASVPPCEAQPCPAYPSEGKVDTVVELAAGRAAALGITPGTRLAISYH